ncbi:MAG: hypothetical protein GF399_09255 [Candidatus Coatesbacteria bacterium]|nr:hypothetical protein [Candidatus Coatesbacteria bacterium]
MFHHHHPQPHHCHPGRHPHEHHGPGLCIPRRFRSQAEKLEMLKQYKTELEQELAGVEEAIAKHED